MENFSDWYIDQSQSTKDTKQWHVYRERIVNGDWKYIRREIPRAQFPNEKTVLAHLREQTQKEIDEAEARMAQQQELLASATTELTLPSLTDALDFEFVAEATKLPALATGTGPTTIMPGDGLYGGRIYRGAYKENVSNEPDTRRYKPIREFQREKYFKKGRLFETPYSKDVAKKYLSANSSRNIQLTDCIQFLVIGAEPGHCLCLALLTYDGRGTINKRAEDHMILYSGEEAVLLGKERTKLLDGAVKVILDSTNQEPLDDASRLDLTGMFKISHEQPVKKIGKIKPSDARKVRNSCDIRDRWGHRILEDDIRDNRGYVSESW